MSLTAEQIEKLHKAVDLAKEPGGCKYVVGGAPCCVVAQLAHLEGVSLGALKRWNELRPDSDYSGFGSPLTYKALLVHKDKAAKQLADIYGMNLLADLQELWDLYENRDEALTRAKMHQRVAVNSSRN